MVDITVIATAAITGAVGLSATVLQARSGRLLLRSQELRRRSDAVESRRRERQQVYERVLDLLVQWQWDTARDTRDYDVVETFSKPFVVAVTRIRVYGSPASIAAVDQIQEGIALLNRADSAESEDRAWEVIMTGQGALYEATRADVGPRPEDELPEVPFRRGAGPRA